MEREGENIILIVNDQPNQLEMMGILLRQAGYQVLTARDGREAFEIAKRDHPHIVVSDVAMPETDGIELCRLIRADAELHATPILLVSAVRKDTASAVEGLQAGADDYLEVPYNPMRLIAKVSRLGERARSEAALRESEERYRQLVELSPNGILLHNEGKIVFINTAGLKLFGASHPEQLLGRPVMDLVHPDYREVTGERIRQVREEGRTVPLIEEKLLRLDGAVIDAEVTATPFNSEGKPAVQVVFRDITARKRAEEALRYSEEQLRLSQRLEAIGRLAGGIAHDFNNLLTVIGGYSELLLLNLDQNDPTGQTIEEIKKASDRAASLTRQLLAFSRKQVLQPKVLDLNMVVAEMERMLRRLIGEDVELITELSPEVGHINADPGQIEQVLMNLIVNARDAMPQGGRIIIETSNVHLDEGYARQHVAVQPGPFVRLAVSDTGTGMNAETQKHIFEPFFTTKEMGKGTGLGLSTVYGIIKQSGGNIWIYSEVGRGTTFKIYLPRVEEEVEAIKPGAGDVGLPGRAETVLLVEDEEMVRRMTRGMLEMNGYRVIEASNGLEALMVCERHDGPIDLLLTDVVMPQMSGRELADRLATAHPEMRVLYMSGYTDDAIVQHGVLEAGTAFLEKPFTPQVLARKVRGVLDKGQDG